MVKKQLRSLSSNIGIDIQPVFRSKPIQQISRPKEKKPGLVNYQCVVYHFKCDQCDTDYVGFTTRHLHQRIHENRHSAIGNHLINIHGGIDTSGLSSYFSILKKTQTRFDCLLYQMPFIKEFSTSLHLVLKRTPLELSFLLNCVSRVNSITSSFIFIIYSSSIFLIFIG